MGQTKQPMEDRLPPHSPEAEAGVLGCVLLSPNDCLAECVERLGPAGGEAFYDLRHQEIYRVLVRMWDGKQGIDLITVQEALKQAGQLEDVGGLVFLTTLPDRVPSAANLAYYLEIVEEKWVLRRLLHTCGAVEQRIYEWEGKVPELLDRAEQDILAIGSGRAESGQRSMKELTVGTINRMEEMSRGVGMLGGLRTHLGYFDKMTGGLHRKELGVLAGRPGTGKTSKMMAMAANLALREGLPVGIFSLEMSAEDLNFRLLCQEAEVDFHKVRTGFLTHGDLDRIVRVSGQVGNAPVFIDDTPALSILALRAKARRMFQRHKVQVIFVDYVQLMHSTNARAKNREQEVADISGGCKALAKELDIPVVVLAQLNREVAKAKHRKPQLEDLRESGAIEQDADWVEMLYHPKDKEQEDDPNAPELAVNGLIAKQRNGPTGDVKYWFKRWCMKYVDRFENSGKEQAPPGEGNERGELPTNEELGFE